MDEMLIFSLVFWAVTALTIKIVREVDRRAFNRWVDSVIEELKRREPNDD